MGKVADKLKAIQADALVFFVKTHNYHWNIKGMQFFPIHEYTQGVYESFATLYDDCAERVLQLGEKPIVTISDALKSARIKEESAVEFDAKEVLKAIVAEYEFFLKEFQELSDLAESKKDKATMGFADGKIAELEKSLWMLKQTLA